MNNAEAQYTQSPSTHEWQWYKQKLKTCFVACEFNGCQKIDRDIYIGW